MKTLESFLARLALASVLPLLLFLVGWWGSVGRVPDDRVYITALSGLAAGILVDLVWFRSQIARPYEVSRWAFAFAYLFYSACTLGFFMGVPAFNLVPGAAAGICDGRRLSHSGTDRGEEAKTIRLVSRFAATAMAAVCFSSACWALRDPMDTARNLQRMLGIQSFEVTTWMVVGLIAVGSPALVFVQHRLTKAAAELTYGRTPPSPSP